MHFGERPRHEQAEAFFQQRQIGAVIGMDEQPHAPGQKKEERKGKQQSPAQAQAAGAQPQPLREGRAEHGGRIKGVGRGKGFHGKSFGMAKMGEAFGRRVVSGVAYPNEGRLVNRKLNIDYMLIFAVSCAVVQAIRT